MIIIDKKCKTWVKERFIKKYDTKLFNQSNIEYSNLAPFNISGNIFESGQTISEETHYFMRLVAQYYMELVFDSMLIDKNDDNVGGDEGTPYRFVKMYCGDNLDDDTELLSGRWSVKPKVTSFINTNNKHFPITKRVDIVSVCSHHTAPFTTMFRSDSYAVVSYIPEEKIMGISKLQRIVDWVARRGHLQESLTQMIYEEISKSAETKSVYVKLCNLSHSCESLRGAQTKDGAFTSEYYGGVFEDINVRKEVQNSIK